MCVCGWVGGSAAGGEGEGGEEANFAAMFGQPADYHY